MIGDCAFGNNDAQVQYWNSAVGEKWVRHQEVMDQQLKVVTDLLLETAAAANIQYRLAGLRRVTPTGEIVAHPARGLFMASVCTSSWPNSELTQTP